MEKAFLKNILAQSFSGEWGDVPNGENEIKVIRTTNFTNLGNINYDNVITRTIENNKIEAKRLRKGDIILEKSGGTKENPVGRVVYFESDGIYLFNNFTHVLRANCEQTHSKYLFYCLHSYYNFGKTKNLYNKTTGIQNLQMPNYLKLLIPLPSLLQQQKIVAELDTITEVIAKKKEQIKNLDLLVKSQFVEMFGDITISSNSVELSKVCIINPSKSDLKGKDNNLEVTFIPMVCVGEKGEFNNTIIKKYEQVKTGFTYFCDNDILFAKITPCMENGKGAIATRLKNGIGFGSTEFHIIRPIKGKVNSQFIYCLTTLTKFRGLAEKQMTGSAGQKRVPTKFLEKFMIDIPPLFLQNQFADFVARTEKLKEQIKNSLIESENCYNSLMQKYFD